MKPSLSSSFRLLLPFILIQSYFFGTSGQLWYSCTSANYSAGSAYSESLSEVASALTNASSSSLYSFAKSNSSPKAYGMFQCRGDVLLDNCKLCVNTTMGNIRQEKCPTSQGGNIHQDLCHVIYDNNSSSLDGTNPNMNISAAFCNSAQTSNATFQSDAVTAMQKVTRSAPNNTNHYAVTHHGLAYAMAQCDGYLSYTQCSVCLSNVYDVKSYCTNAKGGRVYYGSCFYRYEEYLFYDDSSPSPVPNPSPAIQTPLPSSLSNSTQRSSSISAGIIAGVTVAGIILVGLVAFIIIFYCRKKKDGAAATQGLGPDSDFKPIFSPAVVFSYEDLQVATRDFHPDTKLGQGGFGPVFKGSLAEYGEVAIKKLSTGSKQGKSQFMNEVSIITSVQHKNLIKLYGCCVEGSERLLVYEYLPNKSLDLFLFGNEDGSRNTHVLNWRTRFDIVLGIARGLAYLHEDSQVRIIHRDIKPSNVLLDEDLIPKISDFGLARLFSEDISHITTRPAGTLGYLSPEYAMRGQLTEKSDVYSYGVLALEIVSGRKNADYDQPEEKQRLLDWAWNCFNEGEQLQVLDPRISNMSPPVDEVLRVIHVALLCVQASAIDRPSMTYAIQLLSGQTEILERPNMPPYLGTTKHNYPNVGPGDNNCESVEGSKGNTGVALPGSEPVSYSEAEGR